MSTVTRGRFGVTRDPDGTLAAIYYWPWYWRYPIALVGLMITVVVLAYLDRGHEGPLVMWCVGLGGGLASISVAYELIVLGLFAAIVLVPAKLASALFPDVTWGDVAPYASVAFGVYVVATLHQVLKRLDVIQREQQATRARVDQLWLRHTMKDLEL